MANRELLDVLNQGVARWNQWRKEHAAIQPDLTRANINGASLSDADLHEVDFRRANLSGANLSGVNLGDANLSYAYLRGVNLSDVNLSHVNLSYASMGWTVLGDVDLSVVLPLMTVDNSDFSPSRLTAVNAIIGVSHALVQK